MAHEDSETVVLQTTFYRDSIGKVWLLMISLSVAIVLLAALSVYIYMQKPKPVNFNVGADWRIVADVPLDQPYLSQANLLQWVNDAVRQMFVFDFYQYNNQLKLASDYFTSDGWKVFLGQLNNYVNYNTLQTNKTFVNAVPTSAPFVLREGLLGPRYGWWVQIPITINYVGYQQTNNQNLTLQLLVVRVPTLNNLNGVGIDNVIVQTTNPINQPVLGG